MAFAQGTLSRLAYVPEVTWGVTPGTPAMKTLRNTGHTLELTRGSLTSAEFVPDRNIRDYRLGVKSVQGSITGEASVASYDDFLAAAMLQASWTADVLKIGTTLPSSFTIEAGHADIAQYQVFTGCMVNKLTVSLRPNAMSSITFDIIGKDMTIAGTQLGAPSAAPTNSVLAVWDGVLSEGGSTIAYLTALDFTLDNGITTEAVLGSAAPAGIFAGRAHVNGTISALFQDAALLNKFVNETTSSIQAQLVSGNTFLQFKIPALKYNRGGAPVNKEGALGLTMPFEAFYSVSDASTLVITRDLTP